MKTPKDAPAPATKLIYILGWGHSGSTLMDLTIGSSPNVMSVGEIIFFGFYRNRIPHRKVLKPFFCTCGAPFHDCPFWSQVLAAPAAGSLRVVYDDNNAARLRWFLRFLRYVLSGRRAIPPATMLGDDAALLRMISAVSGPRTSYLCDSSKDFARLIRLLMMPGIEVYPIFLVRDMQAVAHSYAKKKRHDLGLNRMGYYRALFSWAGVNLASWTVAALSRRPVLHVSYDLFCRNPGKTVTLLNDTLGLDIDGDNPVAGINRRTYHNIGGNLMRFKTLAAIRYDDSWKRSVPSLRRLISHACFGLFNRIWVKRDATTALRSNQPDTSRQLPPPIS